MTMWLEIAGALVVGIALGLLGAGGSMLTIPILVYVVGEPKKLAILQSLAIVGIIAATSVLMPACRRLVDWRSALLLLVPGVLGATLGGALAAVLPAEVQMLLFAALAFAAASRMFSRAAPVQRESPRPAWQPILAGIGLGLATGLVGVGGGFLIVPVLVLLLGLPMHRAVASSLVVIAGNCAIGFAKQWWALGPLDEGLRLGVIALFAGAGVAGSVLGTTLAPRLPQRGLRVAFGCVLLLVATGMLAAEGRSLLLR
jgi:uncharacterized membrane protein YfcA